MESTWRLSPSDFAFLWEECKRCFYLKVVKGVTRPSGPLPKIFTVIDSRMKAAYLGRRTELISKRMPPGKVTFEEKQVESQPISVSGHSSRCYIKGRFDAALELDSGEFGVVAFKTSERNKDHIAIYARQLHAYAYALENPAPKSFALSPISTMGLLVFEPDTYKPYDGKADLTGSVTWIEIPRRDDEFFGFLSEVLTVIEAPAPPPADPNCAWCLYRGRS